MKTTAPSHSKRSLWIRLWKPTVIALWALLILYCFLNKDALSLSEILHYSPANPLLAALVMMLLFALKSLTVVLFCGLLYAASGVLFPLPVAFIVNIIGTAVMVSLPYWLGRQMGTDAYQHIIDRYPKAERLHALRQDNDGFFAFVTRLIGVLPCDVVSFFMGAIGVGFRKYVTGSLLGFAPLIITFTVMGMSITDPLSPPFIIAVVVQVLCMIASPVLYHFYKKRHLSRCQSQP